MNICKISIAYSPAVRKINSTNRARVWIKILPVAAGTHNPLSGGIILYEIQTKRSLSASHVKCFNHARGSFIVPQKLAAEQTSL